jgi:hypothetical protein
MIEGANTNGQGTVSYCIFDGNIVMDGLGAGTWRGNITSNDGCGSGQTWIQNRHNNADCSVSDVQDSGALDASRFVNKAAGNYRPASTGVAQVGAGDPANFPSTDLDGTARPQGANPDQGAFEIVGGN